MNRKDRATRRVQRSKNVDAIGHARRAQNPLLIALDRWRVDWEEQAWPRALGSGGGVEDGSRSWRWQASPLSLLSSARWRPLLRWRQAQVALIAPVRPRASPSLASPWRAC